MCVIYAWSLNYSEAFFLTLEIYRRLLGFSLSKLFQCLSGLCIFVLDTSNCRNKVRNAHFLFIKANYSRKILKKRVPNRRVFDVENLQQFEQISHFYADQRHYVCENIGKYSQSNWAVVAKNMMTYGKSYCASEQSAIYHSYLHHISIRALSYWLKNS